MNKFREIRDEKKVKILVVVIVCILFALLLTEGRIRLPGKRMDDILNSPSDNEKYTKHSAYKLNQSADVLLVLYWNDDETDFQVEQYSKNLILNTYALNKEITFEFDNSLEEGLYSTITSPLYVYAYNIKFDDEYSITIYDETRQLNSSYLFWVYHASVPPLLIYFVDKRQKKTESKQDS